MPGTIGDGVEQRARNALSELLRPSRLTAVVDVGANPIDGDPPYKEMLLAGLCNVIGFEPQAAALAALDRRKGPRERYLPHAIGDGSERTLRLCREPGMSSLLAPDRGQLALFTDFARHGAVEKEVRVATRRLDDIAEIEAMDLLKIDIQGGELDVFRSAQRLLAGAVAVQTEVSFITLYQGQPAFGEVDTVLRGLGFVPHCFAELKVRPLAPLVFDGDPTRGHRQLLEADLVYVRNFTEPGAMTGEQWKHLALIAHHCYDSMDLVFHAIQSAVRLGAVKAGAAEEFLRVVRLLGVPVQAARPLAP